MKIKLSDYYKTKGFSAAYLTTNRENRKIITLKKQNGEMHTISYAKYLYTSYYKTDIFEGDQVDHINNDKTDDRIENLQVISRRNNINKSSKKKEMLLLVCPICKQQFLFPKRNLSTHPNPCCSRKCGGIKSHLK